MHAVKENIHQNPYLQEMHDIFSCYPVSLEPRYSESTHPFMYACMHKDITTIQDTLLHHNNLPTLFGDTDDRGYYAFDYALFRENYDIIHLLLTTAYIYFPHTYYPSFATKLIHYFSYNNALMHHILFLIDLDNKCTIIHHILSYAVLYKNTALLEDLLDILCENHSNSVHFIRCIAYINNFIKFLLCLENTPTPPDIKKAIHSCISFMATKISCKDTKPSDSMQRPIFHVLKNNLHRTLPCILTSTDNEKIPFDNALENIIANIPIHLVRAWFYQILLLKIPGDSRNIFLHQKKSFILLLLLNKNTYFVFDNKIIDLIYKENLDTGLPIQIKLSDKKSTKKIYTPLNIFFVYIPRIFKNLRHYALYHDFFIKPQPHQPTYTCSILQHKILPSDPEIMHSDNTLASNTTHSSCHNIPT